MIGRSFGSKRDPLASGDVLDAAAGLVRNLASPWLGVLWLTELPLRIVQLQLAHEILRLGDQASRYGEVLSTGACVLFALLLPALWGRAVYFAACRGTLAAGRTKGAWRIGAAELLTLAYTTLFSEILFFGLAWTVAALPLLLLLPGLAAATAHRVRSPGLLRPWQELAPFLLRPRLLLALLTTFGLALLLAWFNLGQGLQLLLWLAEAAAGGDLPYWQYLLRTSPFLVFTEFAPNLICVLGAGLIVEPFWLAALAAYVHRLQLKTTGDDLRLRLHALETQT